MSVNEGFSTLNVLCVHFGLNKGRLYSKPSYSQELPRRFRKDIVKAASKSSAPSSGLVSAEGIESILRNIGAGDQMSRLEIESMLREVSNERSGVAQNECVISADQLLKLLATKTV